MFTDPDSLHTYSSFLPNYTLCIKSIFSLNSYFNFKNTYRNFNKLCNNTSNYSLKVLYQNIRGLKIKLIILRCSFPMFQMHNIIILIEPWLSPDINDAELGLIGFQVVRFYRNPHNSSFSRSG